MKFKNYLEGVKLSFPVFIGYFSVSFGFGALAILKGLSVLEATIVSVTNVTSAGQFAGLAVIASSAPLVDMLITQIVINSRYSLMGVALSQKMGNNIGIFPRMLIAFHNTDEIFALAMNYDRPLTSDFLIGLGTLPVIGWTSGTFLGAIAGTVLPTDIRNALGFGLYGMFIAIIVPQIKKSKPILFSVLIAISLACAFKWVPYLNRVTEGMVIVICAVFASLISAYFFPIDNEEKN